MKGWSAGLAAALLAACASRPDPVGGLDAFRLLQEALREGDAPVVFAMLAPPARDEWLAAHSGADDPTDRWTRYLADPACRWSRMARAEVLDSSRPDRDTLDLTLLLDDGFTGVLRLRRAGNEWFVLPAPFDSPDTPLDARRSFDG